MSKFVLRPARILQTRLVLCKGEPAQEYTFEQLVEKFLPTKDPREGVKLGRLRRGAFVGLTRSSVTPTRLVVFVLHNEDNSGNIDFVLKNDPTFESRFICAYRVDEAEFDAKFIEGVSGTAP